MPKHTYLLRTERHLIKPSHPDHAKLWLLCHRAKDFYNLVNYQIRQAFFSLQPFPNQYELLKALKHEEAFKALPAQTAQQVVLQLFKNWKAHFAALKEYKNDPTKFKAKPRPPGYKDKQGACAAYFTEQQCRVSNGWIKFPQKTELSPIKTQTTSLGRVRIVPDHSCFWVEIVYKKEVKPCKPGKNRMAIDLGIDNLATCVNDAGTKPFVINGKVVKAWNQFYNKKCAELQSRGKKQRSLFIKRKNRIRDYFHKASRKIIQFCLKHRIGKIAIGLNPDWKQNANMGKATNQKFVAIPFADLIWMIRYKAEEFGIEVTTTEESYTSKVDNLALEPLGKRDIYLGKRVKRGLFQSSTGTLLNADINGALGIGRKVFGDSFVRRILDRGRADRPYRWNLFLKQAA